MDKTLKKKSRNLTQDELRKMMKQKQKSKGSTLKLNKRPSSSAILSKVAKRKKEEFDSQSLKQKIKELENFKLKVQKKQESSVKITKGPKSILSKTSLVAGYASSSSDSEMETTENCKSSYQDDSKKNSSHKSKECVLPEGFFDDEDVDARVQGKDTPMEKLDKEYELFQHEMKVGEQEIEDIKDEEHEKKNIDRSINEIDEQLENYKKLLANIEKKEEVFKVQHQMEIDESSTTDGGSSSDEELDWRDQKLFS